MVALSFVLLGLGALTLAALSGTNLTNTAAELAALLFHATLAPIEQADATTAATQGYHPDRNEGDVV